MVKMDEVRSGFIEVRTACVIAGLPVRPGDDLYVKEFSDGEVQITFSTSKALAAFHQLEVMGWITREGIGTDIMLASGPCRPSFGGASSETPVLPLRPPAADERGALRDPQPPRSLPERLRAQREKSA